MRIESSPYNTIFEEKQRKLKTLLRTAWSNTEEEYIHPKEMDAMCFCAIVDEMVFAYVGVISLTIFIENETYRMCGLSSVCTHLSHQHRGIGCRLVNRATQWIATAEIFDIGLFTCEPMLRGLYEQGGTLTLFLEKVHVMEPTQATC